MKQRLKNHFFNMTFKITFFTTLVVFVLSIFLYTSFKKYNIQTINQLNEALMYQIIHNAEQTHEYVRNYMLSLVNNLAATDLMYNQDLSVVDTLSSMRALDLMLDSNPFIESMYIYNGRSDTYYVIGANPIIRQGGAFDPQIDEILKGGSAIPSLVPIPRIIKDEEAEGNPERESQVFTYVLPYYFMDGKTLKSALMINAKVDSFLNNLAAEDLSPLGVMDVQSLWFLGRGGDVFAHTNKELFLHNVAELEYVERILDSAGSSGYFVEHIETPSVVTFVHSKKLDWKLVGVTPYDRIANIAGQVRSIMLGIVFFTLAFCLIVGFILTKNLYAPVRKLRNKFNQYAPLYGREIKHVNDFEMMSELFSTTRHNLLDLEKFRNTHWLSLKQKALSDLIRSGLAPNLLVSKWVKEYGIMVSPEQPVALAVIKIDRYASFCNRYNDSDRALVRYALTNIASEIMLRTSSCETVDLGEDHVVLLFNPDEQGKESLVRAFRQIQLIFEQYCGEAVSIFVSETMITSTMKEIPSLYRDALDLSYERLKYGGNCLLFREDMVADIQQFISIDNQLLTQLLEAIKDGKITKIEETYAMLTDILAQCDYNNIMYTLSYLTSAVFNLLHLMENNSTISFGLNYSEFNRKLKNLETLEEIHSEFRILFQVIVERMNRRRDEKTELIVAEVMRYIEDHYGDLSLNLHSVAGIFKMNAAYLNKLYRERTSHSVNDFITEVRVEQAKRLLRETSLTIEQIIDRIGWENKKYFYTVFKKHVGATPSEFRLKQSVDRLNKS